MHLFLGVRIGVDKVAQYPKASIIDQQAEIDRFSDSRSDGGQCVEIAGWGQATDPLRKAGRGPSDVDQAVSAVYLTRCGQVAGTIVHSQYRPLSSHASGRIRPAPAVRLRSWNRRR